MAKIKMKNIILSCIFIASFNQISAMEIDPIHPTNHPIVEQLQKHLDNHEYPELREILYNTSPIEKDLTGKIFNWVTQRAKNQGHPFFWYIIARKHFYEITSPSCATSSADITNLFRAMTLCLIRIAQDVHSLKAIDSTYNFFNTYTIFKNKFKFWWGKTLKEISPDFNLVTNQVNAWFNPKTGKNNAAKFRSNLSCPDWVITPYTSRVSYTTIYYQPVNTDIKIMSLQTHNIETFKVVRKDIFEKIFPILERIAQTDKSDQEKWEAFFSLDVINLE